MVSTGGNSDHEDRLRPSQRLADGLANAIYGVRDTIIFLALLCLAGWPIVWLVENVPWLFTPMEVFIGICVTSFLVLGLLWVYCLRD